MKLELCLIIGLCSLLLLQADESPTFSYPAQLEEKAFDTLIEASPFQRTINIEDTYSLRAIATYGTTSYVRVYNSETKKTVTIELNGESQQGLKLLKIIEPTISREDPFKLIGDEYLSHVTAQISFAGEVAELKYDPAMIDPALRKPPPAARGGKGSGRGGKGGKGPSAGDRDTYRSLSDAQRNKLHSFIRAQRSNSNIPREQRMLKMREAMQTLSKGGDITIPGN